jgi:hypothetical protein
MQALKDERMNNVYEDWGVAICPYVRVIVRAAVRATAASMSELR